MDIAVYPGSFDPITYGHLDIIKRASKMMDKLIVCVLINSSKSSTFSIGQRVRFIKNQVKELGLENVEVVSFSGLLVDFAKSCDAKIIIRGLRAVTDFEYEFQMALANRTLCPEIETLFISTSIQLMFVSSSFAKEIAKFGGNIDEIVPEEVKLALIEKFNNRREN